MKLAEFASWRTQATTYWTDAISTSGYPNTAEMIAVLVGKMDALQVEYDRYVEEFGEVSYKSTFKFFLLQLMGYVSMRLKVLTPDEVSIGIPELIPDEDVRNVVQLYGYVMPEFAGLFTIVAGDPPNGVLADAAGYTNLLSDMSGIDTGDDIDTLEAFRDDFAGHAFYKGLYMAYGTPPTTVGVEKDVPDYIRENMHLLELMDAIGISFYGVDHHYYNPDGSRGDI